MKVEINFDEYKFGMLVYYDDDSHTYEILLCYSALVGKRELLRDFTATLLFYFVKTSFIFIRYYNCLTYQMEGVIKMDRTIVVEYFDGEKKVKKVIILK